MNKTILHLKEDHKSGADSDDKPWNLDQNVRLVNVKKCIPLLHNEIPDAVQEKARIELNETDENIQEGLAKIKTYLKKEKLPPLYDDCLVAFLRVSKYEMKKAQDKLKRYCQMRYKMAGEFDKMDLETVLEVMRKKIVGGLPFRDEDGRAIFYTRAFNWYPEICEFEKFATAACMVGLHIYFLPITSICGGRYLCDWEARNYKQYYQYYKALKNKVLIAHALPLRANIDCIHDNSVCHFFYSLIHPFLPKKIAKRLKLHGYNYESLHREIDISILPEEYGGPMGSLNNEFLMQSFEEFFHKFKTENAMFLDPSGG